jgi:hypothetical protein
MIAANQQRPLFSLGQVVATPGALEALEMAGNAPSNFLRRHIRGDWGDLSSEDKTLNDESIQSGARIFSSYQLNDGEKVWVITEAADDSGCRLATTILLPSEY